VWQIDNNLLGPDWTLNTTPDPVDVARIDFSLEVGGVFYAIGADVNGRVAKRPRNECGYRYVRALVARSLNRIAR
jgi:hypothetical protein